MSSGVSHSGFGSIVSLAPSGGGTPPNGTFLYTLNDITYPNANGGTQVGCTNPDTLYTYYFDNQTCDINVYADGLGGSYQDWGNPSDIKYKSFGVFITDMSVSNTIEISGNCTSTNSYSNGSKILAFYHDGSGSSYTAITGYTYAYYGYQFFTEECWSEELGTYTTTYYSDNNGGYFT